MKRSAPRSDPSRPRSPRGAARSRAPGRGPVASRPRGALRSARPPGRPGLAASPAAARGHAVRSQGIARGAPERVQKILSERGVASRRRAEDLIRAGRVTSSGRPITLGEKVAPDAPLEVDGGPVSRAVTHRYVLLNKPVGVLSTARDERGRQTVVSLVGAKERLYPVGRLDSDSEGLLLLTNDGAWAERVLHPRYGHEREYEVAVTPEPVSEQVTKLKRGVPLEEGLAKLEGIRVTGPGRLRLVLRTGWKRQVRRMCAAVGLRVTSLRRVRLGPIDLGTVPPGRWRELTEREVRSLGSTR